MQSRGRSRSEMEIRYISSRNFADVGVWENDKKVRELVVFGFGFPGTFPYNYFKCGKKTTLFLAKLPIYLCNRQPLAFKIAISSISYYGIQIYGRTHFTSSATAAAFQNCQKCSRSCGTKTTKHR